MMTPALNIDGRDVPAPEHDFAALANRIRAAGDEELRETLLPGNLATILAALALAPVGLAAMTHLESRFNGGWWETRDALERAGEVYKKETT